MRKEIREDLAKLGDKLKVPADQIYIPKVEDIKYTIGSQWKQRYIVEKDGILYISPIQYNADTDRWVNYNEATWDKNPWLLKCGGCHATGVDLEKQKFVETRRRLRGLPRERLLACGAAQDGRFRKTADHRQPGQAHLGSGGADLRLLPQPGQVDQSTRMRSGPWATSPAKPWRSYFKSTSFAGGDAKHLYGNEFSKAHHQQYIDWKQSKHFKEGVTCVSCHYVHQIGVPPTRSQTQAAGSKQCFQCHVQINQNMAHSIHSFANCVGCHMPRIVTSAESGDLHSHVFVTLLPSETLKNKDIPNSCQTCHKHKNEDLKELQAEWEALAKIPKPVGVPWSRSATNRLPRRNSRTGDQDGKDTCCSEDLCHTGRHGGRGNSAPAASGLRPGGGGFRHPTLQGAGGQHGLL